jgi:hypothetical protein
MKQCPTCELVYADERLNYCKWDGDLLVAIFAPEGTRALAPLYTPPLVRNIHSASGRRGVWLYRFPEVVKDAPNEVVANLQRLKIDTVFLSVTRQWLTKYPAEIKRFIGAAHLKAIEVHAMTLESSRFIENQEDASQRIAQVLDFCNAHLTLGFDGIHLDTEAHSHKRWKETSGMDDKSREKWKAREDLMRQYLGLIKKVARQINGGNLSPPLQFSSTVGWYYDGRARNGDLPSGAAAILSEYFDFLVPMVYDGRGRSGRDIIGCAKSTVKAAPTMVGLAAKEFRTYSELMDAVDEVEAYFQPSDNFRGICIFKYETLIDEFSSSRTRGSKIRQPH